MKKIIFILMVGTLFAQESPCEDETYLELKKKKLDEMSDWEYDYFSQKSTECATLLSFSYYKYEKLISSSYSKFKYLNQIRFGQNFTTNNQDEQMAEDERNKIILELKTYFIDKEKERLLRQVRQESLACSMKFIRGSYKLVKRKSRCNGKWIRKEIPQLPNPLCNCRRVGES